jgi:hypothetical protein
MPQQNSASVTKLRQLQSTTYSTKQYCSDYKAYYYSYDYWCPTGINDLFSSLDSFATSISSSTTTYSTAQYCSTYKTYYYTKSYTCPSSISLSSLTSSTNDLFKGINSFESAASSAKSIIGAIIGGVVGGIVLIIILIVVCCCCCCKKANKEIISVGNIQNNTPSHNVGPVMQTQQPMMQAQPMQQYPGMMPMAQPAPIVINV